MDTAGYVTNYVDESTGSNYPIAYLVPSPIIYFINRYISFQINIYSSQASYLQRKNSIASINRVVNYNSQEWLDYFDTSVLDQPNVNYLDQCFNYLKTVYPENQ